MRSREASALSKLTVAVAFAAGALGYVTTSAQANTSELSNCAIEGSDWSNHYLFRASLGTQERDYNFHSLKCQVESVKELQANGATVRLTLNKLFVNGNNLARHSVRLVDLAVVEAGIERKIGSVFLDTDPLNDEIVFQPQVRSADGAIYVRLSPRHRFLYRIAGDRLFLSLAFDWRAATDGAFFSDSLSGVNLGIDLEKMEGRVAYRAHAHDPSAKPASAYSSDTVLVAKLVFRNFQLASETTKMADRPRGAEPFLDSIKEGDEGIRASLKALPEGTEPCSLGGWSNDTDPSGLNVRAAPSTKAKVLGIIPPPRMMPKEEEAFGPGPVKSEFRIIGHRDGWFLIDRIKAPGVAYRVPYPRHLPKAYEGQGWVSGHMIGGALANGRLPMGRLYASPHADASWIPHLTRYGEHIGTGDHIRRIHACSGRWALINTVDGQRGWWRAICSNQATNCS